MNELELLEFAAKAAGLCVVGADDLGMRISTDGCCTGYRWNPLTDDGDALLLACALKINIVWHETKQCVDARHTIAGDRKFFDHGRTREQALRSAIVTVAAEIGEAKE